MKTQLQRAATEAKDWLWLYIADAGEMNEAAIEAKDIADKLEAAINAETDNAQHKLPL